MEWFAQGDGEIARFVLQRGVAALFVIAFVSTALQFPALLGEHGLLPVRRVLDRGPRALRGPTLFRLHYSDRMLRLIAWSGAALGLTVVVGLPQLGPPWVPLVVFLAMWSAYLSIVNVGQTFYAFGWETLLLEAGFTVAFLGSDQVPPPTVVLLLVVWLVFRLEFGAGLIKLRGDPAWRDLTALYYHHETQPMPGPFSRAAHYLPKRVHRLEVVGNHVTQLIVPFLLFFPQPVASVAAALVILSQLWLVVTGNFAWLNWITIVLAFAAVSDRVVHAVLPFVPVELRGPATTTPVTPLWWLIGTLALAAAFVVLSYRPIRNLMSKHQLMNASFNRLHLVNAYGAFGSVTRPRYEVVVEGTLDEDPRSARWAPYEFRGKPGDPSRRPGWFAPYHLRLDWLMWFLPLGGDDRWFGVFLQRLLEADRATLRMLRSDPFDGGAPTWVRARLFAYRFATRAETRDAGLWWIRTEIDDFVGPTSLSSPRRASRW